MKNPDTHMSKIFRILLLFNANKIYDREIIEGVGKYIASTGACWEVYVEDDYLIDRKSIDDWYGDGIIADLDDPDIAEALAGSTIPTVGVGSSYEHHKDYPHFPYVATDNRALIESAVDHFTQRGLTSLAFYGANPSPYNRWAKEREKAFLSLTKERGYNSSVFRGFDTNARNWTFCMNRITDWIQQLPKPIGIVAVTDSRARHIIQACANTDILVPENVAVIGIGIYTSLEFSINKTQRCYSWLKNNQIRLFIDVKSKINTPFPSERYRTSNHKPMLRLAKQTALQ